MIRHFCICFCRALVSAAIALRAAHTPDAGTYSQTVKVWTNDDFERLHDLGLICIVGQINEETPKPASLPKPDMKTRGPEWYAEQAARLRDELERRRAQLDGYRQAIEDERSLKTMTCGIIHDGVDIGIAPEYDSLNLTLHQMKHQDSLDTHHN